MDAECWPRPELFQWLQRAGEIQERDLWHTFNLGIGYCLVLPETDVAGALQHCESKGFQAWTIGSISEADGSEHAPVIGLPA